MGTQYFCSNEQRREAVRKPRGPNGQLITPTINGIDYLEVASDDETKLVVYFLQPLPGQQGGVPAGPALTPDNVIVQGGERIQNVHVVAQNTAGYAFGASGIQLTVPVNVAGDYSTYTLQLVTSAAGVNLDPPMNFDPLLSQVAFSFKVDCPSDFDCAPVVECPPEQLSEPTIDYLAKDYASFRRLLLDRLSVIMPDWQERNPADLGVALVELLAYVGDHLSYYQDAVATEAYLGTARQRISVRRHARLLDYLMHDGCNARAWVTFEVARDANGISLTRSTTLLTRCVDSVLVDGSGSKLEELLSLYAPVVFELMNDITLYSVHNAIRFYTWGDEQCCLPRGATRATLRDDNPTNRLQLKSGDVLIFEEVLGPATGLPADADPAHRHVVRLTKVTSGADLLGGQFNSPRDANQVPVVMLEWASADALPFPLCISTTVGGASVPDVSIARGNVALADHGLTVQDDPVPAIVPEGARYRPLLQRSDVTQSAAKIADPATQPATLALSQDPHQALPLVQLVEDGDTWEAKHDLLGSDRFAPQFVVEVENDGSARLRFGDDRLGRQPSAGVSFTATYRVGNGRAGNVGAEAIAHVVAVGSMQGITRVRNPLPALGGVEPESLEQVRQYAPQAFRAPRTQLRAVTEADYAEVTERHSQVLRAAATLRWTGSWYTMFVTPDRQGGDPVDGTFKDEIRAFLERYRLAGSDLEVEAPIFVSLDIAFTVCVVPGYFRSDVKKTLLQTFSNVDLPDGRRGFFHPDNLTFGQPIYLSQMVALIMRTAGVLLVDPKTFQRWGKAANGELAAGKITVGPFEIARLDNDPSAPEHGKIEFFMEGGL